MTTILHLSPGMFDTAPRLIAESGAMTVHAFRYSSGVEALELRNAAGRAVLLPFRGQQVWDAWAGQRRLTMRSVFGEPAESTDYLQTYGACFVHCGATATGTPGPDDDHALHGELPNIRFENAELEFGKDADGPHITLTGLALSRSFFGPSFAFRPRLRLGEHRMVFEAKADIRNIGAIDMPLMYLAHVNFCPVDGARLVDTIAAGQGLAWTVPANLAGARPEILAWHQAVAADFERHRQIRADDRIEKEFGFGARYAAGPDGWAHALQLLPNGSADFVSHRPGELPYASRWLSRAADRQALGLCLPNTARPLGRAAAARNGQLRYLAPGESFTATVRFGALTAIEASAMAGKIDAINN